MALARSLGEPLLLDTNYVKKSITFLMSGNQLTIKVCKSIASFFSKNVALIYIVGACFKWQ